MNFRAMCIDIADGQIPSSCDRGICSHDNGWVLSLHVFIFVNDLHRHENILPH